MSEREDSAAKTPGAGPARTVTRHGPARVLLRALLVTVLLLAALLALSASFLMTQPGAKLAISLASRLLPGFSATWVSGTVADGLALKDVRYVSGGQRYSVQALSGTWHVQRPGPGLQVSQLRLHGVEVKLGDQQQQRTPAPQQLRLPFSFELESASIDTLQLVKGKQATTLSDIALSASSDKVHHRLLLEHATTPWGVVQARATLDGSGPLRLDAQAGLAARNLPFPLALTLRAQGPLERLPVQVNASSGQQDAKAELLLTPWAELPLESARIAGRSIDPQAFLPDAPHARLDVEAGLAPMPQTAGSPLTLRGRFSFTNKAPGPLDTKGIPLQSGSGELTANAQQQQLRELLLRFPGAGRLTGSVLIRQGETRADLHAHQLDLRQLASPLVATSLSGPVLASASAQEQALELDLQGEPMAIRARGKANQERIEVQQALLRSGPSVLEFSGTLGRADKQAYEAQGRLVDFDPRRFIDLLKAGRRGSPKLPKNVLLNAELKAAGALKPGLSADLSFDIHDSQVNSLPVTGQGRLRWNGSQVQDSRAHLEAAGNRAQLEGSFGGKGQVLRFSIDAPALARLGLHLSGRVEASGTLAGSIDQPALQAQWQAQSLVAGDYRLERASGHVDMSGLPWLDAAARLDAQLDAAGLRAPQLSLERVQAAIEGSAAAHALNARVQGRLRGQPVKLAARAQGELDLTGATPRWHGSLQEFSSDAAPRVQLQQAVAIDATQDSLQLGATQLRIEDATLRLQRLQWQSGLLSSAGSISNLQPVQLLALQRQWLGQAPALGGDLALDASWDLQLDSQSGQGYFRLQRKSGELLFDGPAGRTRSEFSALYANASLRGSELAIDARAATARLGELQLSGTVGLQPQPGSFVRPGPDSSLALRAQASVPDLARVSALAGPRVVLEGRLSADIALAGTLSSPSARGEVLGDRLALTLFDQGVRLTDGHLRAHLVDEVLQLDELVLRGGGGTLRAQGQVQLVGGNPDLRTDIVASHLQLLADPGRQLTLSGRATAFNPGGQLRIEGGFTVDQARFALPEKSAPRLDDDVVVVDRPGSKPQGQQTAKADPGKPAGLLPPRVALSLDLGRDFRFQGGGADLRLDGSIQLQSGPAQAPQASGVIRVAEGTYEAFGAKLAIERGALTFQGPLDNPALNILAMRRNQDVAAGVRISGTAQRPRAELVSEPDVSQEEKLSWLVFGRGTSNASGGNAQAQSALQGAALGLLNRFGSAKVGKGLGLSQLSIGSSQYTGLANQPVVTLGKEISNRLAIGYEQSLSGVGGVVRLTYELSRHWSVVLLGGTVAGLDLLYSKRFDHWGEPGR